MSDPQLSSISQILQTLGMTREDLDKRSDQMRQFLTAESLSSLRAADQDSSFRASSSSDIHPLSRSVSSSSLVHPRSRASSYSKRDVSPPATPVKCEPQENGLSSSRHIDSMEIIIERQRRQNRREKRGRRERRRDSFSKMSNARALSPSARGATPSGFNLDSFMELRDIRRISPQESEKSTISESSMLGVPPAPPMTPVRNKYYRDHTRLNPDTHMQRAATPTPVQLSISADGQPSKLLLPPISLSNAEPASAALPVTPRTHRIRNDKVTSSPLPPSSPPLLSSPLSSPARQVVNLVSSPGPMGPLPDEEDYDSLPYTLPPGPYSPNKPDLSYAALVGQAILSSPEHRLTLQEIYDWITIVYPHFKRGEQTWMNSIRHVLSTTVCFRKVPRDRSIGRTQWAIWDEDLECFKDGGFKKQYCKDIMNGLANKDKLASSKGKARARKRANADDASGDSKKQKRVRTDGAHRTQVPTQYYVPSAMPSLPIFPATRPTPQHQPYYESCLPQTRTIPSDVIFPPLPPGVGYARFSNMAGPSTFTTDTEDITPRNELRQTAHPDSSSSMPGLTPNRGSSSSPPHPPFSDRAAGDQLVQQRSNIRLDSIIHGLNEEADRSAQRITEEDKSLDSFWVGPSKGIELCLEPGATLISQKDDEDVRKRSKNTKQPEQGRAKKKNITPPDPVSPTLDRKSALVFKPPKPLANPDIDKEIQRTPSPSTPPQTARQLPISSVRTPLSQKNPSDSINDDRDLNKTPGRQSSHPANGERLPVTPRKLVFPTNQNESPFRTPVGVFGSSPFRTPGSRAVFDPHDPSALLDDELNRISGNGDSPAGLFGKGRGSLLYDSPGLATSPGQWPKWW